MPKSKDLGICILGSINKTMIIVFAEFIHQQINHHNGTLFFLPSRLYCRFLSFTESASNIYYQLTDYHRRLGISPCPERIVINLSVN